MRMTIAGAALAGLCLAAAPAAATPLYTFTDLGLLAGDFSSGQAAGNGGHVVGQARDANGDARATLWIDDLVYDLNELLIGADGWTLDIAWGVNDLGWITGNARDADGNLHGFILTPVPEPASMTILACGGLALLLVAGGWRQRTARAA